MAKNVGRVTHTHTHTHKQFNKEIKIHRARDETIHI